MTRKSLQILLLSVVVLVGFILRLYKIDIPLADHHSWRQADTAAVARNFIKEGWSFFQPKIDNMIPLHPNRPNTTRLFMVEPPIYNSVIAFFYHLFGVNVTIARLVSVFFYLTSGLFLFLLVRRLIDYKTALFTLITYFVLPFGIFFSRTVLPEAFMLFTCLGMLYFCDRWRVGGGLGAFILFLCFSAASFTQKAFPLFLLLPVAYLFVDQFRFQIIKNKYLYLWAVLVFIPLLVWRYWVSQFPDGIPANLWLLNQGDIRFKGAFFYWLFAKRIGELILGFWGLPLLVLGLVAKTTKKEGLFFYSWAITNIIFLTVFAAGNVTHDYYQIPLLPILAVFVGKGLTQLFWPGNKFNRFVSVPIGLICFVMMLAFSWYSVRDFYNIQGGVDLAGAAVDRLTPKDALVITGDSNDVTLLYNTNRHGWTIGYASAYPNSESTITHLISQNASYYVATVFDRVSEFGQYMLKTYPVIDESNQHILFKLIK